MNLEIILSESDKQRFLKYVDKKDNPDECWNWKASLYKNGYGQFGIKRIKHQAHRISWVLHNGEIPFIDSHNGMCVLHKCDNPACVNPSHLFLGTHSDNVRDMVNKGRGFIPHPRPQRGEANVNHKLTEQQVIDIRDKYIPRIYTQYKLAAEYGIKQSTVSEIISRKKWDHIK